MRPRTVYGVYCELHCGAIAQDSILSQHISDHIHRSRMTLHRTLKFKADAFHFRLSNLHVGVVDSSLLLQLHHTCRHSGGLKYS